MLKKFYDSNKNDLQDTLDLNRVVKTAEDNLKWDNENLKDVREYLKAKKGSAASIEVMKFFVLLPFFVLFYSHL